MSKNTIPPNISQFLNDNFGMYEDVANRSRNLQKLAEQINSQNNFSGIEKWDLNRVRNYYYSRAKSLRTQDGESNYDIPFQIPNTIYHNNSLCFLVKSYRAKDGIHCYYKCKTCGTSIPTILIGDNKVNFIDKQIHNYCTQQAQKQSETMTNLLLSGVVKAQTLLKSNKIFGPSSCIQALRKEMPELECQPLSLSQTIVQTAYKETRKEGFIESIIRSSTETSNDSNNVLYVLLHPRKTIAFCSAEQKETLKTSHMLFVDGTFDETSPEFKKGQLLNILTIDEHGFPLPLIHILMTKRTEEAYIHTFEDLKHFGCDFTNIQTIMCDFEVALISALQTINEGVKINGCFYHYCAALNKFIDGTFNRNEASKNLFQLFKNIVIIDEDDKNIIISELKKLENQGLNIFLEYYCNQWLHNSSLSYLININYEDPVTNNVCESFHSELAPYCQYPHPNLRKLSDVLRDLWIKYSNASQMKDKTKQTRYQFKN